jgi:hypothetical protein
MPSSWGYDVSVGSHVSCTDLSSGIHTPNFSISLPAVSPQIVKVQVGRLLRVDSIHHSSSYTGARRRTGFE